MKIIRYNTFETNSSSTTTLIVQSISDENPLFSKGVLNLSSLHKYEIITESSEIILADTRELKLALILAAFNPDTYQYGTVDFPEEVLFETCDELKRNYNVIQIIGEYNIPALDTGWPFRPNAEELIEIIENPKKFIKFEIESRY